MNSLEELKASTSYKKRKPAPLKLLDVKPFNSNHLMNMQSAVKNRDLINPDLWKTFKNEKFLNSSKSIKYMNKFNKYTFLETPKSYKSEIRTSPKALSNAKMKIFENQKNKIFMDNRTGINFDRNIIFSEKISNRTGINFDRNIIFSETISNFSKTNSFKNQQNYNYCNQTYEDYPVNYLSVQNPTYIKSYYLAYENMIQNSVTMGTTTNSFKVISRHLKPELYTQFLKMGKLRKLQVSSSMNKNAKKTFSPKINPQNTVNDIYQMDIFKNLESLRKEERIEKEEEIKKNKGRLISVKKFNFLKNKQFSKCLDGKIEAMKKGLEEQLKI